MSEEISPSVLCQAPFWTFTWAHSAYRQQSEQTPTLSQVNFQWRTTRSILSPEVSKRNCAVWHSQVTLSQTTEWFLQMVTNFLTKWSPGFQGNLFRMIDGKGGTLKTPLTSRNKTHQTPYQLVYYQPKTHTHGFVCKRSQHHVRKVCQHQRKFLGDFSNFLAL